MLSILSVVIVIIKEVLYNSSHNLFSHIKDFSIVIIMFVVMWCSFLYALYDIFYMELIQ